MFRFTKQIGTPNTRMKKNINYLYLAFLSVMLFSCQQNKTGEKLPVYRTKMQAEVKILRNQGDSLRKVDVEQAMDTYKSMLALAIEKKDVIGQIEAYRSLVFVSSTMQGVIDTALKYSDQAVIFGNKLGDANTLCDVYSIRAVAFQVAGKIDSATAANKLALDYMDKDNAPDSFKNWSLYMNVANFYSNQLNNHTLAIEYTFRYLNEYALNAGEPHRIETSYNNLGLFYMRLNDSINAKKYLYKAKDMHKLVSGQRNRAYAQVAYNLFIFYTDVSQNIDSSKYYLDEFIGHNNEGNQVDEINAIIGLSAMANKSEDKALAQDILHRYAPVKFLSNEYVDKKALWVLFTQYYQLYELLGDNVNALSHLKTANKLMTDAWNESKQRDMEQFEIERKKVMQENKLLANELKIKNKNNTILLLTVVSIIIALAGFLIFLVFKRRNDLLRIEKEFEKETSMLKGQLEERNRISRELHDDLGASLTSIALSGKILKQQNPDLQEDLNLISNTANDVVDNLNEIVWSLNSRNDSLNGLVAYIRKFATTYLGKVNISLQVTENLSDIDIPVLSTVRRAVYLTSKEAVNNIAKHSDASSVFVDFNFQVATHLLKIIIKDNGSNSQTENNKASGGGNGLHNMKRNMELIGGSCTIAQNDGFTVEIAIVLDKEKPAS